MAKLIDNYILVQTIFTSDNIQKHKGRNLLTKDSVFIKTIKIQKFYSDMNLKEQILNEINLLKKINLQCIVKMIKMLKSSNNVYLIYQNIQSGIETYNNSISQFFNLFVQSWKPAYKMGIVHGNLKPTSILIQNNKIKVKGLTCARIGQGKFYFPQVYCYSAPEIFLGSNSSKSDIFSLGLIIYEMIFKKLPYPKDITIQQLKQFWKRTDKIQIPKTSNIENSMVRILELLLQKNQKIRVDWQILFKKTSNQSNLQQLSKSSQNFTSQKKNQSQIDQKSLGSGSSQKNSKFKKLVNIYGQKRNKLSFIVTIIKQLINLLKHNYRLESIIQKCIVLLKNYSTELKTFVQSPNKIYSWVDNSLEKQWKNSSFYYLVNNNQFEDYQIQQNTQQIYPLNIYNDLKDIDFQLQHKKTTRFCLKLLSDLQLVENNKLVLRSQVDQVEQQLTRKNMRL